MILRSVISLAGVLPPLIALVRIVRSSVNVPFSDEWDWTDLAVASRTGTLSWATLWEPHNGHRQIVPNLFFVAVDKLGGWNVVREELVGLAFIVVALIALWRLFSRALPPTAAAVTFAVLSWLIAGPIAYENFLSGWQVGWQLCVAAVLIVVERLSVPERSGRDVAVAACAAVLASFSAAMGLMLWPCGVLVLAGERAPRRAIAVWTALAALTVAAYLFRYSNPAAASLQARSAHDALLYALTFLGAPLRNAEWSLLVLQAAGTALLAGFVVAAVWAWPLHREPGRYWPWFALGAYALGGMALTAFTRSGIGVYQAQSPRYVSISQFLIVALAGLWIPRMLAARSIAWRAVSALGCALVIVWLARAVRLDWIVWRDYDYHRQVDLDGLARDDPAALAESYPDVARLRQYLAELRTVDDGPLTMH